MVPKAKLRKQDGKTGVVRPSEIGILAIIASCSTGTSNEPASYTRDTDIIADKGYGHLPSYGSHVLGESGNPIVAVKPATSTPGAYGAITQTGTGATVATGDGTLKPYDEWDVLITCTLGGTVGTGPISYTYSLDGGVTTSAVQALSTATSITIPNTGVKINLTSATWVTGDTVALKTTAPYATTSDLVAALDALRTTSLPWEGVLVDGAASTATVAQVDAFLADLETRGIFRFALMNTRLKTSGETEAAYAIAMTTATSSMATARAVVGADGGDMVDRFAAVDVPRPTSLWVAGRAMAIDIAEDPALVARGPLTNCSIDDVRGNAKYHDEDRYPGLDDLRLTTLRTFSRKNGVFICNANLISTPGSDYTYLQLLRTMNEACGVAWEVLTDQLSRGVTKSSKVGPAGQRYISEESAAAIEGLVNAALTNPLKDRVTSYLFTLSRTDDISSNAGAKINGDLAIVPLAYVKEFDVNTFFTKTITTAIAA